MKVYVLARRLRASWMQAREDEGREGVGEVLVVLGQAAVSAEPGKGPFNYLTGAARRRILNCLSGRLTISTRSGGWAATTRSTWRAL